MESRYINSSGKPERFRYEKRKNPSKPSIDDSAAEGYTGGNSDEDLIIEDNTVYEVDRECFERLKRLKKKKD